MSCPVCALRNMGTKTDDKYEIVTSPIIARSRSPPKGGSRGDCFFFFSVFGVLESVGEFKTVKCRFSMKRGGYTKHKNGRETLVEIDSPRFRR